MLQKSNKIYMLNVNFGGIIFLYFSEAIRKTGMSAIQMLGSARDGNVIRIATNLTKNVYNKGVMKTSVKMEVDRRHRR